jgi:uncharacterized protein
MNKFSKALVVAGIGLALTGLSARAQSPAPKGPPPSPAAVAAAVELLTMKKAITIYQNAVPAVVQRTKESFLHNNLNLQKDLDEIAVKLATELGPRRDEIGKAMAQIYASNFTEDELKGMLAFYKSPLGQKLLATEPKTLTDSYAYMNEWSGNFANEVANRFRSEMKARGKQL